jgi:hypothetical protein
MTDTLLYVDKNGNETIWYSGEYIKKLLEAAFRNGLGCGARVELHYALPYLQSPEQQKEYCEEIKRKLFELIQQAYDERRNRANFLKEVLPEQITTKINNGVYD